MYEFINEEGQSQSQFPVKGNWKATSGLNEGGALSAQAFKWLGRWELIVPSRPYNELALDCVDDNNRIDVSAALGDLRAPLPDHRIMFLTASARMKRLWKYFNQQLEEGRDPRLALLMAIWKEKPYYKLLPAGLWVSA